MKISTKTHAYYWLIIVSTLFYYIISTLGGLLLLSLFTYIFVWKFTSIDPYSFSELMMWADGLPEGYKIALFTSGITVIGFLVAFHAATVNWKSQMKAELSSKAAYEIQAFIDSYLSNLVSYHIYAEQLIKALDCIADDPTSRNTQFHVGYSIDQAQESLSLRNKLSQASADIHRLFGKYGHLQNSTPHIKKSINQLSNAISDISKHIYFTVPICEPLTVTSNPADIQKTVDCFQRTVDRNRCLALNNAYEEHHDSIAGNAGRINGVLHVSVSGNPLFTLWNLLRQHKAALEGMQINADHARKHGKS